MSIEENKEKESSLVNQIIEIQPQSKSTKNGNNFYDILAAKADDCFGRMNFKIYESEKGERIALLLEKNVCSVFELQKLSNEYLRFCCETGTNITNTTAKDWVGRWIAKQKNVIKKLPPSFSLNKNEISFNHINIDLNSHEETLAWDSFISRCGKNGEAVMAFIWSIFENNCKSHQYLYIWGVGGDGKGSLLRWLEKMLGNQYQPLEATDKYWPAACVGKRIGIFADLNNTKIALTSQFKEITGRDKVMINQNR